MTNSYLDMLIYVDEIINIELTSSFLLTIWLIKKGVQVLWNKLQG
jgi:hypothetical protein